MAHDNSEVHLKSLKFILYFILIMKQLCNFQAKLVYYNVPCFWYYCTFLMKCYCSVDRRTNHRFLSQKVWFLFLLITENLITNHWNINLKISLSSLSLTTFFLQEPEIFINKNEEQCTKIQMKKKKDNKREMGSTHRLFHIWL